MIATLENVGSEDGVVRLPEEKVIPSQLIEDSEKPKKLSIDMAFENDDLTQPTFSIFNYEGDTFTNIRPELSLVLKSSEAFEIELRLPPDLPPGKATLFGTDDTGLPAVRWIHRQPGVVTSALRGARLSEDGKVLTLSWKEPHASGVNTSILSIPVERDRIWGWFPIGILYRPNGLTVETQAQVAATLNSRSFEQPEQQFLEHLPEAPDGATSDSAAVKVEMYNDANFGLRYGMFNYPDLPGFDFEPAFMLAGSGHVNFQFEYNDERSVGKYRFSAEGFQVGGKAVPSFRWFDLLTGELKQGYPTNLMNIEFSTDPSRTGGQERQHADVELLESNPDLSRWGFVSFYLILEQVDQGINGEASLPQTLLADPTVVCNPPVPPP